MSSYLQEMGFGLVAGVLALSCSSGPLPEDGRRAEAGGESVAATAQALDQACMTQCLRTCVCSPGLKPPQCRAECTADCTEACSVCTPSCAGKACGQSDGCDGVCSGGACPSGQTCGGGGVPNQCGCTPSCAGKACGQSDGCGGVCSGGACPNGQTCGGAGTPNQCGCTPHCSGQTCGAADGCGGICTGPCPGGTVCGASGVPGVCATPNTTAGDFVEITAGDSHTCARKLDGSFYCWGINTLNQVGIYSTAQCSGQPCVNRPRRVTSGSFTTALTLDAGFDHTCALDPSGRAFCWGASSRGQLGAGVYGDSLPLPVNGGLTFTNISAGQYSTCGTGPSGLYCWGAVMAGGGAPSGGASSPWPVLGANGAVVLGATGVSVGYLHACARTANGTSHATSCFGNNSSGQAGSSLLTNPVAAMTPTQLSSAALGVKTQGSVTCADLPSSEVQCFGNNDWGALGNGGSTASTYLPQTVGAAQGLHLHGVTISLNHGCALDANGAAYCWGVGTYGQLGNNAYANTNAPVAVAGGLTFRALAAGGRHTCGIGTDNHLYCWGGNQQGQLGTTYPGGYVGAPVQAMDP